MPSVAGMMCNRSIVNWIVIYQAEDSAIHPLNNKGRVTRFKSRDFQQVTGFIYVAYV